MRVMHGKFDSHERGLWKGELVSHECMGSVSLGIPSTFSRTHLVIISNWPMAS